MYMALYPNEVALKSILLGSEISVKLTHFASNKWNYWHGLLKYSQVGSLIGSCSFVP